MRRFLLASAVILAVLGASEAAYNEPVPVGSITGLGAGVLTVLKNVPDAALGLVSYNSLIADINALGGVTIPISGITGLGTNVATALGNATDAALGLVTYNALAADWAAVVTSTQVQTALNMSSSVFTATQIPTNVVSGLLQLNSAGLIPSFGQVGVTAGTAAAAGNIGEVIASDVPLGSAVSVSTATPKTITSVALTPGDWTCAASIVTAPAATTTTSQVTGGLSTTTNVLPTALEFRPSLTVAIAANTPISLTTPDVVENISTNTTIFLVEQSAFATSTMSMYGQVSCRRMR